MVRAGVVNHPGEWEQGGYREIQEPAKRYGIIDLPGLANLCGFADMRDFQRAHRDWIEQSLENSRTLRDDRWSEAIAVGSLAFVENIKTALGIKALHCEAEQIGEGYALRERSEPYPARFAGKNEALSSENTLFWNESVGSAVT